MQKFTLAFAILSLLTVSAPAMAQTGRVTSVCAGDIQRFCARAGHGGRKIRACLEANRAAVSPECQIALGTRGGRR